MKGLKLFLCSTLIVLITSVLAHAGGSASSISDYLIVPLPNDIQYQKGRLQLNMPLHIDTQESTSLSRVKYLLAAYLVNDFPEETNQISSGTGTPIKLSIDPQSMSKYNEEAYQLIVNDQGVNIIGASEPGLFYGLQTFRQMLRNKSGDKSAGLQHVVIIDEPRFSYRGMHLDVGRHFFPVEFIKKYIDLLAMYKFNRFHWHLTEDQGWRIEIKKYPLLTEVGGFRKGTEYKGKSFFSFPEKVEGRYGGFYTQEEIKDVVAYAQDRQITIIPEIELPGHSSAALAAYPQFGCIDKKYEVSQSFGIKEDIYCPKEETFQFLEDVLSEVVALFPSEYIHVGGDEAPKVQWESSELAQKVIKENSLVDEDGLQSYFIQRIENFLHTKNRKIIGWDEILQGGIAKDATVMSWRGMQGGVEAAKKKHQVIMSPIQFTYFDLYQGSATSEPLAVGGYVPIERVYEFEPVPESLDEEEAAFILGAQGQVWTEYMRTPEEVEYMVIPRIFSLAEVLWTQASLKDWSDFKKRVPNQYSLINAYQYNSREETLAELPTIEKGFWRSLKGYWFFVINYFPVLYYEVFQKEVD